MPPPPVSSPSPSCSFASGPAISPSVSDSAPNVEDSASALPPVSTRTLTSAWCSLTHTRTRFTPAASICASPRRSSVTVPKMSVRNPENAPFSARTSPERLPRSVCPMRSATPVTSPRLSRTSASAFKNCGIWSTERSSTGVPNSAMAVFARSAGSRIASSARAVTCIA
ncbi:hypothetical protein ESCO106046_25975 [Escherichia coli]